MGKVFLEGLPGAGKTTLFENIKFENPELKISRPKISRHLAIDTILLSAKGDQARKLVEYDLLQENSGYTLKDRSFLSMLTTFISHGKISEDIMINLIDQYDHAIKSGILSLPDLVVYLDIDPKTSVERQQERGRVHAWGFDNKVLGRNRALYNVLFKNLSITEVEVIDNQDKDGHITRETELKKKIIDTIISPSKPGKSLDLQSYKEEMQDIVNIG